MNEEQMRAAFEDWWKQTLLIKHDLTIGEVNTYCKRSPEGDYVHASAAMRWEGWKAALAHQAKSVPVLEKAVWVLKQIANLDPKNSGLIGTAVFMAKEAIASMSGEQK